MQCWVIPEVVNSSGGNLNEDKLRPRKYMPDLKTIKLKFLLNYQKAGQHAISLGRNSSCWR